MFGKQTRERSTPPETRFDQPLCGMLQKVRLPQQNDS
jgi:hypothetical protein